MANHCYNSILFCGKDLGKIKEMIAEAIEVNKTEGWLPESLDKDKLDYVHYLFDVEISTEEENWIQIQCWTKWAPPILELEQIGREAGVSITCWYEESGMCIYGQSEYNFETNYTTDIYLDDADTDRVQYDEENDQYLFDGEPVESDSEAYQTMLDEKLNNKDF
jgi:hypothetical protein